MIAADFLTSCQMQLRLTPDQIQEKRAAEASVAEAKGQLDESEDDKKGDAAAELAARQQKLEQLMQDFQVNSYLKMLSVTHIGCWYE